MENPQTQSLEERLVRIERAVAALVQAAAKPSAPAAPADPVTAMAAAWEVFGRIQAGAQEQVQRNYAFMRELAREAAAGNQPGSEWAPVAEAVTRELLPAVADFVRAKAGVGTAASWDSDSRVVHTVAPTPASEPKRDAKNETSETSGGPPP